MIYLDSSVALAQLLAEGRCPPGSLWEQPMLASRLLEYESWVRLNAAGLARSHGDALRELLSRVGLVDLAPPILARALEPFPARVRTLDALHLATMAYLRDRYPSIRLASYDRRFAEAARAMRFELFPLRA